MKHRGRKSRINTEVEVGSLVRCLYRVGWYGRVVELNFPFYTTQERYPSQAVIELICTRDGRPYHKPPRKHYHVNWLEVVPALPERYDRIQNGSEHY